MENTGGGGGGDGEDVLIQILVCLPVKSLLRFKSVCKSWRALIESSFFIDLHTTTTFNSSSSSKFGTFILQAIKYSGEKEIKMFMLSSGDGDGDGDGDGEDDDDDDQVDDLRFSPFYKDFQLTDRIRMVGSCNGLICLHDLDLKDVFLWNPATRQFRILPILIPIKQHEVGMLRNELVAFGFDVKTKDYKVVWITPFVPWDVLVRGAEYCMGITRFIVPSWDVSAMGEECMCRVQVYSLNTDSWKLLEGIDSLPVQPTQGPYLNHGIYLNGSYFFVGRGFHTRWSSLCINSLMLSFDFTKEIFTTMEFPEHDNRHRMVLSQLGDKIAVFATRSDFDGYEYCDIWVLINESWTKLHSFRIINRGSPYVPYTQPLCISNNGEFALVSTKTDDGRRTELQLFNLVTKEAKKNFLIGNEVCRADVYKQSLVSIIGGNGAATATSQ